VYRVYSKTNIKFTLLGITHTSQQSSPYKLQVTRGYWWLFRCQSDDHKWVLTCTHFFSLMPCSSSTPYKTSFCSLMMKDLLT